MFGARGHSLKVALWVYRVRQYTLVAATAFAILYALAVFWRVSHAADIKIYCLFAQQAGAGSEKGLRIDEVSLGRGLTAAKVRGVGAPDAAEPSLPVEPSDAPSRDTVAPADDLRPHWVGYLPKRNDRLLAVGGVNVNAFPEFADAVAKLQEEPPKRLASETMLLGDPALKAWRQEASIQGRMQVVEILPPGAPSERWAPLLVQPAGLPPQDVWVRVQTVSFPFILLSGLWCLLKFGLLLIAVVVALRRTNDESAQAFFGLSLVSFVAYVGGFHWSHLVLDRTLLYPFIICAVLVPPITLHFFLIFPRKVERLRARPRLGLALIYGPPLVWLAAMMGCLLYVLWVGRTGDAATPALRLLGDLTIAYLPYAGTLFGVGVGVLIWRFFWSPSVSERNQVKWIVAAAAAASVPISIVLYMALSDPVVLAYGAAPKPLMLVSSVFFTVAFAFSITRYKLLEAGPFINRWIIYFLLSFAATALFCVLVALWTLVGGRDPLLWGNALVVGLSVLLLLLTAGWWGDRHQRDTERRLTQEKYQLDKAIRRLGEAVDELVSPAEMLEQVLQAAVQTISAQGGAVYLRREDKHTLERISQVGGGAFPTALDPDGVIASSLQEASMQVFEAAPDAAGAPTIRTIVDGACAVAVGLEESGRLTAVILLGAKEEDAPLTPEDRGFLMALARTAGLALRTAQGVRTVDLLRQELEAKLAQLAEQQRRILFLQGELLDRTGNLPRRAPETPAGESRPQPAADPNTLRHDIRGASPAIQNMLAQVAKIARSPSSVLIRGESGVGKELLAQAIHWNSPQMDGPFVAVHCAALSPTLLESELFGHVRGAFTGADREKIGRFEMAHRGTLFLDEIGDVNPDVQTKLLRVLQEQKFERVGGTETISVDVRVIAATHRDLEGLIAEGRFREDLYYRLNVISLLCPPLRDRGDDVLELSYHFLRVYSDKFGRSLRQIDPQALAALQSYPWPGNIRQLENCLERAVVLAEGETIQLEDLPPEIIEAASVPVEASAYEKVGPYGAAGRGGLEASRAAAGRKAALRLPASSRGRKLSEVQSELERRELVQALADCRGNKALAAKQLGIPRSTLFSKLKKYGLE